MDKLIQPALLAILTEGPSYGYDLAKRLGEIPGFLEQAPDMSGVYKLLKTLEGRGMVIAEWDVSDASRSKRLYSITEAGHHCLQRWHETLQKYRSAIDSLLKTTDKAQKRIKKQNSRK